MLSLSKDTCIWNSKNLEDLMTLEGATMAQVAAFERVFRPLRALTLQKDTDLETIRCVVEEIAVEVRSFPPRLQHELLTVVDETVQREDVFTEALLLMMINSQSRD